RWRWPGWRRHGPAPACRFVRARTARPPRPARTPAWLSGNARRPRPRPRRNGGRDRREKGEMWWSHSCGQPNVQTSTLSWPGLSRPSRFIWQYLALLSEITGTSPVMTSGITVIAELRHAALETLADHLLRQLAADEDDAAFALLAVLPRPLVIPVQDHMHALEHEALRIVLERQDALAAQNVRSFLGDQILDPGKELVRVERPVGAQRHRLHLLVVIMLQAAAVMMVVAVTVLMVMVMVVVVIVIVVMVVLVRLQEGGLDIEDAVEVEGIAAEHLVDGDLRALRAVQLGIRIDAADARLELAQFLRAHQVGLVDEDDVGKGDLVLGLRCVLEAVLQPFCVGDSDDGVELGFRADVLVHEEGLCHRRGVGQASRLNDDGVELALT